MTVLQLPIVRPAALHRPVVGVVVPAYNAERWLAATLLSLQAQDWTSWVCIIVDDGSTDDTAEVAIRFCDTDDRIRLLRQANAGLPSARNSGIAELPAECEYVAFLDSDDLYQPNALSALVESLQARPDAVGSYGLAEYVDEHGELLLPGLHPRRQRDRRIIRGWRLKPVPHLQDATFDVMVVNGPIWPPAVALQRMSDVLAIKGFDASFKAQEDWDFYVRLARRGPYVAIDEVLAGYRRHGANMSGAHPLMVLYQEHVRRNAYTSPDNSALQTRQVARAWRYLEVRQAAVLGRWAGRCLLKRRWRDARIGGVGSLMCLATSVHPGPPPASPRRVQYTRPFNGPGATMIPEPAVANAG